MHSSMVVSALPFGPSVLKHVLTRALAPVLLLSAGACRHETDAAAVDAALFREAPAEGSIYYSGTPGITLPDDASPHGPFRVRFNSIAQTALDTTGRLPVDGEFPAGSVIVKDLYEGTSVHQYAVMKKDPDAPLAGSGWLWAELAPDGAVIFSASRRGDGCIPCHSQGLSRDLVRVFDLH